MSKITLLCKAGGDSDSVRCGMFVCTTELLWAWQVFCKGPRRLLHIFLANDAQAQFPIGADLSTTPTTPKCSSWSVFVSTCCWVYNSRLWSFWHFEHSGLTDVLKSPTPSVHCNLHLEFPTVLRRKSILILFSDVGVCFTVGLLVTSDTVRYSDCSLDATWTWGNNGGQVGTNTRQYTTSSAVRCASSCIRKSWFVNFKWSVTAQWAVRYCSKSRNCTDVCGGILYTYYTV